MANQGPVKLTQEEITKFQAILRLPAGDEKTRLQQALSSVEKTHFAAYIQACKRKKEIQSLKNETQTLQAREKAQEVELDTTKAKKGALVSRLEETEAKLKELKLEETALVAKDRSIVVQGSRGFARELDGVKKQPVAPAANKQSVVATGPKY